MSSGRHSIFTLVVDSADIIRGSVYFHLLARAFGVVVVTHDVTGTPVEQIRLLRQKGLSLSEIVRQSGTTVPIVRRAVGKVDHTPGRLKQDDAARKVHALGDSWSEQAAAWRAETGRCEVTYWRVLKRIGLRVPRNARR